MFQKKQTISFNGHKKEWDTFRLICKLQDTDASKQVRKLINEYIENNIEIVADYEEEKARFEEEQKAEYPEEAQELELEIQRLKEEWEKHND